MWGQVQNTQTAICASVSTSGSRLPLHQAASSIHHIDLLKKVPHWRISFRLCCPDCTPGLLHLHLMVSTTFWKLALWPTSRDSGAAVHIYIYCSRVKEERFSVIHHTAPCPSPLDTTSRSAECTLEVKSTEDRQHITTSFHSDSSKCTKCTYSTWYSEEEEDKPTGCWR